jgi:hypothetical protein
MGIYPSGARAVFVFLLDLLDKLDEPGILQIRRLSCPSI